MSFLHEINTVELKNNSAMKDKYIYKLVNVFLTKGVILCIALLILRVLTFILSENNSGEKNKQDVSIVDEVCGQLIPIDFLRIFIVVLLVLVVLLGLLFLCCFICKKIKKNMCENNQEENEDLRNINLKIDGLKKDVEYLKTMISTKKYDNNDKDNNGISVSVNVNGKDY